MSHNRYNKEVEQCQVVDQTAGAVPLVDGRTGGGVAEGVGVPRGARTKKLSQTALRQEQRQV
jgi:hypothetical protein